jgi:hypothetical protein
MLSENGSALLTSLVMLLMLSITALLSSVSTQINGKIITNIQYQDMAFSAAENTIMQAVSELNVGEFYHDNRQPGLYLSSTQNIFPMPDVRLLNAENAQQVDSNHRQVESFYSVEYDDTERNYHFTIQAKSEIKNRGIMVFLKSEFAETSDMNGLQRISWQKF